MAIIDKKTLIGDTLIVEVDSDPNLTPVDVPEGTRINFGTRTFIKTDSGATTNVRESDPIGWRDNIRQFSSARGNGTAEPVWSDMGNGQYAMRFREGNELFVSHHIDHDYLIGSNAYPHIHFLVDEAMSLGDVVTWRYSYVIAKGHQQGESLTAPRTSFDLTYTADGTEIAGEHIVLECSDLQAFDLKEPDTIVLVGVELIKSTASGKVFGVMTDMHYLTDRRATPNKAPNFYV